MKTASFRSAKFAAFLVFTLASASILIGADSTEQATIVKEKIQSLRTQCEVGRAQITITLEELNRLKSAGAQLRPQFERFKAELVKMDEMANNAKERADSMKQKGEAFFSDWEQQVKSIKNEDIRDEAAKRMAKRKKAYDRILTSMQEAKQELVPFMSDLNDIRKLLDSELSASTVGSIKGVIRKASWHGEDVRESLSDVEKELDRVAAELAKYQ